MGCTHSKTTKQASGQKVLSGTKSSRTEKEPSSRPTEEVKTCREIPPEEQKKQTSQQEKFVYPDNEVTALPPEPPSFGRKKEKTKRRKEKKPVKTSGTGLRDFAKVDKEAFLADRRRVKEKRRQILSEEDEDTLWEQPTRMPEADFTKEFSSTSI